MYDDDHVSEVLYNLVLVVGSQDGEVRSLVLVVGNLYGEVHILVLVTNIMRTNST